MEAYAVQSGKKIPVVVISRRMVVGVRANFENGVTSDITYLSNHSMRIFTDR